MNYETINKGLFELWRHDGFFTYAQFLKAKRIKFFQLNALTGEMRVKLKGEVLYQGKDLDKAIEVYNSI